MKKKPKNDNLKRNSDNRYRLDSEEERIILYWREYGELPPEVRMASDIKSSNVSSKYKAINKKYKAAMATIDRLQDSVDLLKELKEFQDKKSIYQILGNKKNTSNSVAIALASDWHVEEWIDPDTVNYMNEYTLDIADTRIEKFFQKTLMISNLHRNITTVDTLVLALLGDFITGFIHEEYKENNQLTPLASIRWVSARIKSGIDFLLSHGKFKKIVIPCSYGNHGRTTKECRHGTAAQNSFEQHMYYSLQNMYENDDRVEFIINNSYHTYVNLFDKYLLRFHHGDSIRYRGGVGGITIPVNKAIAQWNKGKEAYLDLFGHYHTPMAGGAFISNGSLCGHNAFAIGIKADYYEPQQMFVMIEESRGKTATHPIFVSND